MLTPGAIVTKARLEAQAINQSGIVSAFFGFFQGRVTFFAISFWLVGLILTAAAIWGFIKGRDLSGLSSVILAVAALNGSIQAMLGFHSWKEDWTEIQHRKLDLQDAAQAPQPNGGTPNAS